MSRIPYWSGREEQRRAEDELGAVVALGIVVLFVWALLAPLGCAPAKGAASFQRDSARAAVLLVARGVATADTVCAEVVVRHLGDAERGRVCAMAYDVARGALLTAENAVDAWDAGKAGDVACAVQKAVAALDDMRSAANLAGATMPAVVDDAVALGGNLGKVCQP